MIHLQRVELDDINDTERRITQLVVLYKHIAQDKCDNFLKYRL